MLAKIFSVGVLLVLLLAKTAHAQGFNQALSLGPGQGYAALPSSTVFDFSTGFTFEAWVSVVDSHGPGACSTIAGKGYTTTFWMGLCGTTLRSYIKGVSSLFDAGTVPPNVWTHVAVTYDGSVRRHFINGVEVGSHSDAPPMTTNGSQVRIGSDVDWQYTVSGLLDEVRFWNIARSAAQIQSTMSSPLQPPQAGLVALYHFDGNANDAVGSNNGTLALAAAFATPNPAIFSITPALSGFWYNQPTSGQGFDIQFPGNGVALAVFYTFDNAGNGLWLIGNGSVSGNNKATLNLVQTSGGFFPPNFPADKTKIKRDPWGTLTLTFSDCNNATAAWVPLVAGYVSGSMAITRLSGIGGLTCQ